MADKAKNKPSSQSSSSPAGTGQPLGFLSDPIVQHLQKRGLPLTKAMWLMIDSGSPNLEQLRDRPETAAYLDRLFPDDEEMS